MQGLGPIHAVVLDSDSTVAVWRKNILVQVRRGRLTPATLAPAAEVFARLGAAGQPAGGLMVVEPSAPLPDDQVRKAQRETIESLMAHPLARMAAAVLGEDTTSKLQRSAGRLVALGNPKVQRFHTVPLAAAWLSAEMGPLGFVVQTSDLVALVGAVRAMSTKV